MHRQSKNLRRFAVILAPLFFAILTTTAQEPGFDVWTIADGRRNRFFKCFLAFMFGGTLLFFCAFDAPALDRDKALTQYIHDVWTTREGLPQDLINAIAQDQNGYLWLGTHEGLVRFDGVNFAVFDSRNTDSIDENFIYDILVDREGSLWVATPNHLLRRRRHADGAFEDVWSGKGLPPNLSILGLSTDAAGNLWVNCYAEDGGIGGIVKFKDEEAEFYPLKGGSKLNRAMRTFTDREGNLWVAASNGLSLLKNDEFKNYTTADGLSNDYVQAVTGDLDGNLFIGTANGLSILKDGKFTRFTTQDGLPNNSIITVFKDADGILWIGTDGGLARMIDGKIEAARNIEGLADDYINRIFEDAEGSLWIGTRVHGLHRLRDGKFTVFGSPEGLLGNNVRAIYEDRDGRILIGTSPGGLNVLSGGKLANYSTAQGLSSDRINVIVQDRTGVIWIGANNGLNSFENGKFTSYVIEDEISGKHSVNCIYEILDQSFWLGTSAGIKQLAGGRITSLTNFDKFQSKPIPTMYEDSRRRTWVGMYKDTGYFKDGVFTSFPAEALSKANVWAIREDEDGVLWFGTWGEGLMRLKNDKLTVYTSKDGLFDDVQWTVLDDRAGNLWMSSNRGIFRVSKKDLDDFAEGQISRINSIVYDEEDGMRKKEGNGSGSPAIRTRDGRLWFATTGGAAVIDPKNIKINRVAPPVILERVLVDEKILAPNETEISPRAKNVEFHYAGLSFIEPAKMKYKYKLEGFDTDWIDAGARRTAFYTNLPPGDYEFKITAANSDGIWNEQGASFKFRATAPFWRTGWFYVLIFLGVAGLAGIVYRWRVFNLKQKNLAQQRFSRQLIESQEAERKRIASELHDGLGQSLAIISNRAVMGKNKIGEPEFAAREFDEISQNALAALDEVHEITNNLHPHYLERLGLTKALKSMFMKVSDVLELDCEVDSIDNVFPKNAEINLYRIVQESLNNIIKHSDASEAVIKIKKSETQVVITIKDDGRGFDTENVNLKSGGGGGLGLVGLEERTKMLNGRISINSSVGYGTEIKVTLPTHIQI